MRLELTRRGDYAVRAVLALAKSAAGERLSVSRIAARENIPPHFLPRVMTDLVRGGLVEAVTGRSGGYRLARPAEAISVLDVIEAVEGDARRRTCVLRGGPCRLATVCNVHQVFADAQDQLLSRLAEARLNTLV
jgi:Rrf2 family iron-sulfur cluster assembly transcriptional regulator